MKRTYKATTQTKNIDKSSDIDMDCSCQILNDTSLSNVGDSDCDCSQCLQANLNAFNQFKNQASRTHDVSKQNLKDHRGKSVHPNKKQHGDSTQKNLSRKQSKSELRRYRSSGKTFNNPNKTRKKYGIADQNQEMNTEQFKQFQESHQFTNGQLNDFLLITQNRTRKYLDQRKKLKDNQDNQKKLLKQKIKKNLQILRYTAQMNRQQNLQKKQPLHQFKWGHDKYICQCNGKFNPQFKKNCCAKQCRNTRKTKTQIDTNLNKLKQNFVENRDHILQQAKLKRDRQIQLKQKVQCQDMCPNHHNRTDPGKIKQIENYIKKNIKKHQKKQKREKQKLNEQQKIKQAKLKAIEIKSKQILKKSKKYDPSASRTSFRLSIQNYDTFSELRQQNARRKQMKQIQNQTKKQLKNGGGGKLLDKVYEQIQDDGGWIDPQSNRNSSLNYTVMQKMPELRKNQDIYQRIAYDANIKAPKNIKNKVPKQQNNQKFIKTQKKQIKNEDKKKNNLSKGKQQEQKKRIQEQIQRKKKQILKQYQKRNSNNPSNSALRQQYEQKMHKDNRKTSRKNNNYTDGNQLRKDPYRANYRTKPSKNIDQLNAHGDPLLQQYQYHQGNEKAKQRKGQNMGIFTQNIHSLSSKTRLKP